LPGAGLHDGQHSHGPLIDAGGHRDVPTQRPKPVLGDDPDRHSRHHAGAGAAGFQSYNAGDCRDLFHANGADHAWNSDSASYCHGGNGWHNRNDDLDSRGADDISSTDYLFRVLNGRAVVAIRTTSYVVYVRFSRLDGTGRVVRDSRASAFRYHNAHLDAIDGIEHGPHIHGGQHSHGDAIDHDDDIIDRDDGSGAVGDHFCANRRQHDRDHIAGVRARQPIDHCMQLHPGRSADQRRGFAALDARNSGEPGARHDSAGYHAARQYQHRSDDGRSDDDRRANAEHVGMRREHDDE
jgi:hypothetical protein